MVSSANAQRRRVSGDKKVAANVTKRGMVPDAAAERRKGKLPVGPLLLGFFIFVIVGSAVLQIFNSASKSKGRF